MPATSLLPLLGQGLRSDPRNGNLVLNAPLIETLVQQGSMIIPALCQLLQTSINTNQLIEGVYLAQRLAEQNTPGVRQLYAATTRLQRTEDPMLQVYLAGFYRKLNVPESFGPLAEMLLRRSMQPNPPMLPGGISPMEEVGGTLLQQIAQWTAQENRRLLGK